MKHLQKNQHFCSGYFFPGSSKAIPKRPAGLSGSLVIPHILSSDTMIGKMSSISADEEDPFAFCEKYKTGVELIDTEHRRLFEIIHDTNDLIHAELLHDKYDEIMHLLVELKDYTEFHFRDEENLMERIHYPKSVLRNVHILPSWNVLLRLI